MKELTFLGLSAKEQLVYMTLLESGIVSASELAKLTSQNRTLVYSYLEQLKQKGLILEIVHNNKKFFQATNPDFLLQITQNKMNQLKKFEKGLPKIIEQLKTKVKTEKSVGKIDKKIYYGLAGMRDLINEIVSTEGDLYFLGSTKNFHKYFSPEIADKIYTKPRRKKLRTDYLITDWDDVEIKRFYQESGMFTKIRFLPASYEPNGGLVILNNKVIVVQYSPQPYATVVEDETLASLVKLAFTSLWESLEGKNIPQPIS